MSTTPRPILRLCTLVALSGGLLFMAGAARGTATGSMVAWGCGGGLDAGQCTVPPEAASGVTAIAAGPFQNLGLTREGSVIAWGCGGFAGWGQCTVSAAAAGGVTAIAAGYAHSLALKQDGGVIGWGCGGGQDYGQCTVPAAAASGVTAIAAASGTTSIASSSLALKGDGSVVAWGCGDGTDTGQCTVPAAAASGVTAIAAGTWHNLARKGNGIIVAWGCGFFSRIGYSTDWGQCTVPAAAGSGVRAVAGGQSHSLALLKESQTISFGALTNRTFGDPDFAVSASASSGLPVSYAAGGRCTVSGSQVHVTGAGSCTVTASQAGDADYNSAPDVSQTFAIAKAGQSIEFGPLAGKTHGDPDFSVSATASSGLAVSFAASGACTVSGVTVHLTGAGSCTVTASQPGNANYNAAPDVSRTFSIARAPCRVPNVVGKRLAPAKQTVARRHCRTGKVGHAYSRKRKKGIVISQSRRPGRVLPAGSKIDLIVSRGRRR